ncbi:MAG: HAMP domain-containing histidine kinase [Clostridia bacterium]|nr:HAMP domain-containing histidine kinase [Clostridia bacterium]
MKNYFKIVIAIGIIYVLGIVGVCIFSNSVYSNESNFKDKTIILNEITKSAELNWDSGEELVQDDYECEFVVLDNTSEVKYTNCDQRNIPERISVETAIKQRFPYAYVLKNDKCIGSVIILDNGTSAINSMRNRMLLLIGSSGFLVILGAALIGVYVNRNIYKPFNQMKEFAGKIAEGDLSVSLVMDEENMFGSFTESFDIMREELIKAREREIALQKKERELVASLSHDLKTPITGIKVTTELLQAKLTGTDESFAQDYNDKLQNIMRKANQIDNLVNDLFESTLDDLGEIKVNLCDEDASVLNDIIARYDDRKLVRCSEPMSVIINIDLRRMGQVIGNIISNSYKYANTVIDVEYKVVDDYLSMCIRDYGPGVTPDEIGLITNKFYRGKITNESKVDGSGLGLYISKMLMTKMNGELIPESVGNGLAITLLIPLS